MSKPVSALPEWASGANYTEGPFVGLTNKVSIPAGKVANGHTPGAANPTAAEHWNDWLNRLSKWTTWVWEGTSTGLATAHIVETDADGFTKLQKLLVNPTGANQNEPGVVVTSDGTGHAIDITLNGTGAGVDISGVSTGLKYSGSSRALDVSSTADKTILAGQGVGNANDVIHGIGLSGIGVHGQSTGNHGVKGTGAAVADKHGVYGLGGNNAATAGVRGEATHVDAKGVSGATAAGAGTDASAVYGEGRGDGAAGRFESEDGYAVEVRSGGERAPMRYVSIIGNPNTHQNGDRWYDGSREQFRQRRNGELQAEWATQGGRAEAGDTVENNPAPTMPLAPTFGAFATATLTGDDAVQQANVYAHIHVSAVVEQAGTAGTYTVQIYDATAAQVIWGPYTFDPSVGAGLVEPTFSAAIRYRIPATGDRTIELQMHGSAHQPRVHAANCLVLGTFSS